MPPAAHQAPPAATAEPRCARCHAAAVQRCAQCGVARYCSRECQRADWARHKRAECSIVSAWIAGYVAQGITDAGVCSDAEVAAAAEHYPPCGAALFTAFRNVRLADGQCGVFRYHHHPAGTPHCAGAIPMAVLSGVGDDAAMAVTPLLGPHVDAARAHEAAAHEARCRT